MSKTKFLPLYDKILIKRLTPEEKVGSIIIPESVAEKPHMGVVIAVGIGTPRQDGSIRPPGVEAGQTILFEKYSGLDVDLDTGGKMKEEFTIIQEGEILGILEAAD